MAVDHQGVAFFSQGYWRSNVSELAGTEAVSRERGEPVVGAADLHQRGLGQCGGGTAATGVTADGLIGCTSHGLYD